MNRRLSGPATERRRRNKSHDSDEMTEDAHDGEQTRRRVNVACATCRRRKIRCDGNKPACVNCARQGREECNYVAVSAEENQAVKERKQLAKLWREQQRDKEKEQENSGDDEVTTNARKDSVKAYADDPEALPETQLSARRRWNRTIRFDTQGSRSVRSISATSNRSPKPTTSLQLSPLVQSQPALPLGRPAVGPSGLTPSTLAWHLTIPTEPLTAPAATASRTSYFDPAYSSRACYPATPGDKPSEQALPPARLSAAHPVFAPSPATRGTPLSSPANCTVALPTPSDYPLTPPHELAGTVPAPSFDEEGHERWSDAVHPPLRPEHQRRRTLNHSYSAPQLPQYSPTEDWQLYHAIPTPAGVSLAAISPGPSRITALHPIYSPPTPVDPPNPLLPPVQNRQPTSLDFLPDTRFAPSAPYVPTTSLGLQLMEPVENVPLTLAPSPNVNSWAASPVGTEGEYGEAVQYTPNSFTDVWSNEHTLPPQSQEPFDGLPIW
ncbi:hypothetical protein JCM11251_007309 [Rhodosporidiobolus azoricus]